MVAKIGRGSNLYGALAYNHLKVEKEKGKILLMRKMIETKSGKYAIAELAQSFAPYLIANRNTEKHTLHISLNPDPKDEVDDDLFKEMAEQYMQELGYGKQPFIVFKHTDIDRTHIHIVSVCVDENGKKISDKFEKIRSMKICRMLEKKHSLIPATEKEHREHQRVFHPVNYKKGDLKSQMASVIRHLPDYYQFQTLGEYNALLSLFNITAEKVEGELQGKIRQGLLYFPLDEEGEKTGLPFKSSLFGKKAGLPALEAHFTKSKTVLKDHPTKPTLKAVISTALQTTNNENAFKKQLIAQGLNVVVRKTGAGRIYGMTFIDHNSKTVWNGSRLGKKFSANAFNEYWQVNHRSTKEEPKSSQSRYTYHQMKVEAEPESIHSFFDFLTDPSPKESYDTDLALIEALGGWLPLDQGEDYEEIDFAYRMNKKKKKKRKSKRK